MQENRKHIVYTSADIRRYLDGEMSADEMNAFEKAALEDPFLQDALEGLTAGRSEFGDARMQQAVSDIEGRIRKSKHRRTPAWFRYAAAAALIGIVILAAVLFNPKPVEDSALVTMEEQMDSSAPESSTVMRSNVDTIAAASVADSPVRKERSEKTKTVSPPARKFEGENPAAAEIIEETQSAPALESKDAGIASQRQHMIEEIVVVQDPALAKKMDSLRNQPLNVITGKVVNKNNKPVAFAQVYMVNNINREAESIRLLTDKTGYFKVKTHDSLLRVSVEHEDYKERYAVLSNKVSSNNIILDANASAPPASRTSNARNTVSNSYPNSMAEPKDGWTAYDEYLRQATGFNDEKEKEGEVVVSFRVSADGELSSFKIEQSLDSQRDKEAIRIVREGPGWKIRRGKSAIGRIAVVF